MFVLMFGKEVVVERGVIILEHPETERGNRNHRLNYGCVTE